jgi:hypothetical protein
MGCGCGGSKPNVNITLPPKKKVRISFGKDQRKTNLEYRGEGKIKISINTKYNGGKPCADVEN